MIVKTCKVCGKIFKTKPCLIDSAKYCSKECQHKALIGKHCGPNSPCWKPKIKKICTVCNKTYKIIPARNIISKYCSKKCKHMAQKGIPNCNKGKKCPNLSGSNRWNWKGGKYLTVNGYIYILKPDHPLTNKQNYVYEHRIIMEKHLNRFLKPTERVHHINHNKQDNRLENLYLFPNNATHAKFHSLIKNKKIPPRTHPGTLY